MSEAKEGDLKVWWIPQIPMDAFEVRVSNLHEANLLLNTLANYDLFQLENNIKPDYCNMGGLVEMTGGEWLDWESECGDSFDDIRRCPSDLNAEQRKRES